MANRQAPLLRWCQAPKGSLPLAKQNLILSYIQKSGTAHNIKELEKSLPGVASISGMQVKDFLQALGDEGKIRVEKIGSGNWYWSFLSEERKSRETIIEDLLSEKERLDSSIVDLRAKIDNANATKADDVERDELTQLRSQLDESLLGLRNELLEYKGNDPEELLRMQREIVALQAEVETWTDNIGILEGRFRTMTGGDTEQFEALQRELYGSEYVEGIGLAEL